jgi:hypothetical protein
MKKTTFVPKTDLLETRIALSGGVNFARNGAAILTRHALNQTYSQVQSAFVQYMNHGQHLKRLESSLAGAVSRIPFNRRHGLLATVESEASQMQADIVAKVAKPVGSALQRALSDVHDFVQTEIASGTIVMR